MNPSHLNKALSRINLITGIGDFISLFAVFQMTHILTNSLVASAMTIPIRGMASIVGAILFPYVQRQFTEKSILAFSQFGSMVASGGILFGFMAVKNLVLVQVAGSCLVFLKVLFDGSRETWSHRHTQSVSHRSASAQLIHGLSSAQTIGPVIGFALISAGFVSFPIFLDIISFLIAGIWIVLRLPNEPTPAVPSSNYSWREYMTIFKAGTNSNWILFQRSFGFWIPAAIFNVALFDLIESQFGKDFIFSAWSYSLSGMGLTLSVWLLRDSASNRIQWVARVRHRLGRISDAYLAGIGVVCYGLTRVALSQNKSFNIALMIFICTGLFMGLNAVASQSLRRKVTTHRSLPTFISLEIIFAKSTELLVGGLALAAMQSGLSGQNCILIGASFQIVMGVLYFQHKLLSI